MPDVMMVLPHLPPDEPASIPSGYTLRSFVSGDEGSWAALQESTGVYGPTDWPALFRREFGDDVGLHAARMVVATTANDVVGVAAGWLPGRGAAPGQGRIHWVAVHPDHQRRGIGRALVVEALWRLHASDHQSAYLTTGADNLPAIALYRTLGFEPAPRTADESRLWRDILQRDTMGPGA